MWALGVLFVMMEAAENMIRGKPPGRALWGRAGGPASSCHLRAHIPLGGLEGTAVVAFHVAWPQGSTPLFPALKSITKAIHTCGK